MRHFRSIAFLLSATAMLSLLLGQGCPAPDVANRSGGMTANAGSDQSADPGQMVMLKGVASGGQSETYFYTWYQIGGPEVDVQDSGDAGVRFTVPTWDCICEFLLKVEDADGQFSVDTVKVYVGAAARSVSSGLYAYAGVDQTAAPTDHVILYGNKSAHPTEGPLSYRWRQYLGEKVLLKGADTATPTFIAPKLNGRRIYGFVLTVSADGYDDATDMVQVVVDQAGDGSRGPADFDFDGVVDAEDNCPTQSNVMQTDIDGDGFGDICDECPNDADKIEPGACGCGFADDDADDDAVADCIDECPNDPFKSEPGQCGCGEPDEDRDADGTMDCNDECPLDSSKVEPGLCGCGQSDGDRDLDGVADCEDGCPYDRGKTEPGDCGCGNRDTDSDGDSFADCLDDCPDDPNKFEPGLCGCGERDDDSDGDKIYDCNDGCPNDAAKVDPGVCGCGVADEDLNSDGIIDCPPERLVVPGKGHGDVLIGASQSQLVAALGSSHLPPEEDPSVGRMEIYWDNPVNIAVILLAMPQYEAFWIEYYPYCGLALTNGLGVNSTQQEVFNTFGQPLATLYVSNREGLFEDRVLYVVNGTDSVITYAQQGVGFWFNSNDEVTSFYVFRPYQ